MVRLVKVSIGLVACAALLLGGTVGASADVTTGLMGYWPFDDGSGSTTLEHPSAGGDNPGQINGATWVPGVVHPDHPAWDFGTALDFDGSSDYVRIESAPSISNMGSQMTASAWINVTPGSGYNIYDYRHIASKGATYGNLTADYALGLSDGSDAYSQGLDGAAHCEFTGPGGSPTAIRYAGGNPIPQGEWHMVTVTFNSGLMSLYVDGQFVDSDMAPSNTIRSSTQPLFVGIRYAAGSSGDFDGMIDEVRVYNRSLSAGDVFDLYHTPEPASLGLLALGALTLIRRR